MGFSDGEFLVLGTVVVLAGIMGRLWFAGGAGRVGGGKAAEEEPVLHSRRSAAALPVTPRVHEDDAEEPAPESGIRVKKGARVRRIDSQRGR